MIAASPSPFRAWRIWASSDNIYWYYILYCAIPIGKEKTLAIGNTWFLCTTAVLMKCYLMISYNVMLIITRAVFIIAVVIVVPR